MAAIFITGGISDALTSKNHQLGIMNMCTKFHACITNPTIHPVRGIAIPVILAFQRKSKCQFFTANTRMFEIL